MGFFDAISDIASSFKEEVLESDEWKELKNATKELVDETKIGLGIDSRSPEEVLDLATAKAVLACSSNKDGEDFRVNRRSAMIQLLKELNFGASLKAQLKFEIGDSVTKDKILSIAHLIPGIKKKDVLMCYHEKKLIDSRQYGFIVTPDFFVFSSYEGFDEEECEWVKVNFHSICTENPLEDVWEEESWDDKKEVYIKTTEDEYLVSLPFEINEFRAAILSMKKVYDNFTPEGHFKAEEERKRILDSLPKHPHIRYEDKLKSIVSEFADVAKNIDESDIYVSPNIPKDKLGNAISSYAKEVRPHQVVGLYDNTVFGGAKNGFLISTEGIYSRNIFDDPSYIRYVDLPQNYDVFDEYIVDSEEGMIKFNTPKGKVELYIGRISSTSFLGVFEEIVEAHQSRSIVVDTREGKDNSSVVVPSILYVSPKSKFNDGAIISSQLASEIENNTQIQKYHNDKSGHGFAAEDANALDEVLRGKDVDKIGRDNSLDGADRVTNGQKIQTKYYNSARGTVNSAFRDNRYRYKGQLLEVPSDQYDECIKIMEDKIGRGEVPGYSDPKDASKIVKKGHVTYKQARNIAKAGNIDSLIFDAKNQIITSVNFSGCSVAIGTAQGVWSGEDLATSVRGAVISGLKIGSKSFVTGIATSQLLRTEAIAKGVIGSRGVVRTISKTEFGNTLIKNIAKASTGKALSGAAASNHVAKLFRTNLVAGVVTSAIAIAPELYSTAFKKEASWTQFAKNVTSSACALAGGTAGWITAAFFVSNPILLSVAAIGASQIGESLGSKVSSKIGKDDADVMLDIVNVQMGELASDFMLDMFESESLMDEIMYTVDGRWLCGLYSMGDDRVRSAFVYEYFKPYCEYLLYKRGLITISAEQVDTVFNKTIASAVASVN